MITIKNISDLNNITFENYHLTVLDNLITATNHREDSTTTIIINEKNRLKTIRTLEKLLSTKIELTTFKEKEILSFIENEGFSKTIFTPVGNAASEFNMIVEGDRIAIGFSGGKDSFTLLNTLVRIKKISNVNFEIFPILIHPEYDLANTKEISAYCEKLGLQLQIEQTTLSNFLFDKDKNSNIKNPCFLCGRIRRGILYSIMKKQNLNKLALGHHKDDIIETFLMNSFFQGNLHMMKPNYSSKEHNVTIIRPLALIEESNIIRYVKKLNLPLLKSLCPYETSEDSKRLKVKNLIKNLSQENNDIRSVIFNSIFPLLK